jgi:DNA-binding response OmpR family regulator
MMSSPINVLFIEDNPGDARLVKEELRSAGSKAIIQLEWVDRLEEGQQRIVANHLDAVLLDLSLPDSQGSDTLQRVLSCAPDTPVIVMTGQEGEETGIKAVQAGAQDYLIKGQFDGRLLTRVIQYAIERKQTERDLRESEERFRLVVQSAP